MLQKVKDNMHCSNIESIMHTQISISHNINTYSYYRSWYFLADRHPIALMVIIHNFYRFYEGEDRDPPQEWEIQCSKYSLRPLLYCDDCNGDERGGDGLRPGWEDDVRGPLLGLFRVLRVSDARVHVRDVGSNNNHEGVSAQCGIRECDARDCGVLRAGEDSQHAVLGRVC